MATETAEITVTPPEATVTFNDQAVVNGSSEVTIAEVNASMEWYGQVFAADGTVIQSGSPTTNLNPTDFAVEVERKLTRNQTLTAVVYAAVDDTELARDTANITIKDTVENLNELEGQYATSGGSINGDLVGIQSAITDWANGELTDVDGDETAIDEIQALVQRWAGSD